MLPLSYQIVYKFMQDYWSHQNICYCNTGPARLLHNLRGPPFSRKINDDCLPCFLYKSFFYETWSASVIRTYSHTSWVLSTMSILHHLLYFTHHAQYTMLIICHVLYEYQNVSCIMHHHHVLYFIHVVVLHVLYVAHLWYHNGSCMMYFISSHIMSINVCRVIFHPSWVLKCVVHDVLDFTHHGYPNVSHIICFISNIIQIGDHRNKYSERQRKWARWMRQTKDTVYYLNCRLQQMEKLGP